MSLENSNAPQERGALSMITAKEMIVSGEVVANGFIRCWHNVDDRNLAIYDSFKDNIVSDAAHDVDNPTNPWPRCYPNTRTSALSNLTNRAQDMSKSSGVLWVSGSPRSGKSAIAGSLCDILQAKGQLGASFSFRPGGNGSKQRIFATIAFQLAMSVPDIQPHVAVALEENPFIFQQSPQTQMETLVTLPLLGCNLDSPRVVVIDGLDMYGNRHMQCCILSILGASAVHLNGKLKFVVFTRPQPHIASVFYSELFKSITAFVNLDDEPTTRDDIGIILKDEVGQTPSLHGLSPTSEQALFELLVSNAPGTSYDPNMALKYIEKVFASFRNTQRHLQALVACLKIIFVFVPFVAVDRDSRLVYTGLGPIRDPN